LTHYYIVCQYCLDYFLLWSAVGQVVDLVTWWLFTWIKIMLWFWYAAAGKEKLRRWGMSLLWWQLMWLCFLLLAYHSYLKRRASMLWSTDDYTLDFVIAQYMIIMFLLFLVQFAVACACLALSDSQQHSLYRSGWEAASYTLRQHTQNWFGCCGYNVSTQDEIMSTSDAGGFGHPSCAHVIFTFHYNLCLCVPWSGPYFCILNYWWINWLRYVWLLEVTVFALWHVITSMVV